MAGKNIAVWTEASDPVVNLWASRYQNRAMWGTPELIEISNAGPVTNVQLNDGSQGGAAAVWLWENASGVVSAWANVFE